MIEANKEAILEHISYIQYLVGFRKDKVDLQALLNLDSKINTINPAYAKKLRLQVRPTNVEAQKIDGSYLNTFERIIVGFLLQDKLGKV